MRRGNTANGIGRLLTRCQYPFFYLISQRIECAKLAYAYHRHVLSLEKELPSEIPNYTTIKDR